MAAITAAELKWYLSGGSGNTNPAASLGGAISTTEVVPSTLWDTVTGDEASAGDVEYRWIYIKNTSANVTGLTNTFLWILTNTPGADTIEIAKCDGGVNHAPDVRASESITVTDITAAFAAPDSKVHANVLSLGTLAANDYFAIALRRTVPASCAAYNSNSFTLKVEGDTTA